jgi:hypothetical protein
MRFCYNPDTHATHTHTRNTYTCKTHIHIHNLERKRGRKRQTHGNELIFFFSLFFRIWSASRERKRQTRCTTHSEKNCL